jgi:hypothetical protein
MFTAKDCTRSLSPRVVTYLGMLLCFLEVGCSGISGLRSVGTERPSFLGLWDRSGPGSPTPENDAYAQNMRSQSRPDAIAQESDPSRTRRADDQSGQRNQLADTAKPAQSGAGPDPTKPAGRDETVSVSLGRPEPLPGLARAGQAPERLASLGSKPQWKAEAIARPDDDGSSLSQPVERQDLPQTATIPLAKRAEPSAPAEPSPRAEAAPDVDANAILSKAEARLGAMEKYQVKITRLERVRGVLQPEEDIVVSIKRDPKAVRLEWASGPNKGREVIYSSKLDPRMMFVHMPSTAITLPTMRIPIDSPLVMKNSRHAITEAGFDAIVETLHRSAGQGNDRSEIGDLSYRGLGKPAGLDRACHHFARRSPSGETWNIYLDAVSLLPRMVVAEDPRGELIERDVYREIHENPPELAAAGAFVPEERWGESKGLLSRIARTATGASLPGNAQSTTR